MKPELRKQALTLLVAFDEAVKRAQRKKKDRTDAVMMVMARFGGEATELLRKAVADDVVRLTGNEDDHD
jgi:hypothetical protein